MYEKNKTFQYIHGVREMSIHAIVRMLYMLLHIHIQTNTGIFRIILNTILIIVNQEREPMLNTFKPFVVFQDNFE